MIIITFEFLSSFCSFSDLLITVQPHSPALLLTFTSLSQEAPLRFSLRNQAGQNLMETRTSYFLRFLSPGEKNEFFTPGGSSFLFSILNRISYSKDPVSSPQKEALGAFPTTCTLKHPSSFAGTGQRSLLREGPTAFSPGASQGMLKDHTSEQSSFLTLLKELQ